MEIKKGTITTLKRVGYGYIQPDEDNQEQIFFHASGVCNIKFEDLREGMPVNYFLVRYSKKEEIREKAIGVVVI